MEHAPAPAKARARMTLPALPRALQRRAERDPSWAAGGWVPRTLHPGAPAPKKQRPRSITVSQRTQHSYSIKRTYMYITRTRIHVYIRNALSVGTRYYAFLEGLAFLFFSHISHLVRANHRQPSRAATGHGPAREEHGRAGIRACQTRMRMMTNHRYSPPGGEPSAARRAPRDE